mmetsp:Transcript_33305/g.53007  ORF Transcript_33305/g.53007 Transcript_33305/m.53007 type:complete len:403 (+) Transcript_33305:46-1254(+)
MQPQMHFPGDAVEEFVAKLFVPNLFANALADHCEDMHFEEQATLEVGHDDDLDDLTVGTACFLTQPWIASYEFTEDEGVSCTSFLRTAEEIQKRAEANMQAHGQKLVALLQSDASLESLRASSRREPTHRAILSHEEAEATMHAAEDRFVAILQYDHAKENEVQTMPSLMDMTSLIHETSVGRIVSALPGLTESSLAKLAASLDADHLIREKEQGVDQLRNDGLSNSAKTWVAGSPATAVRQMRRSTSSTNFLKLSERSPATSSKTFSVRSVDFGPVQRSGRSQKSAMALDLDVDPSCNRRQKAAMALDLNKNSRDEKSSSAKNTATDFSVGGLQPAKAEIPVDALRPLVISKSAGMIPTISSMRSGKSPLEWDLGPMSGRRNSKRQFTVANVGYSLRTEFR